MNVKNFKSGDLVKNKHCPKELLIYLGGSNYFLIYDDFGRDYFKVCVGLDTNKYFKYEW